MKRNYADIELEFLARSGAERRIEERKREKEYMKAYRDAARVVAERLEQLKCDLGTKGQYEVRYDDTELESSDHCCSVTISKCCSFSTIRVYFFPTSKKASIMYSSNRTLFAGFEDDTFSLKELPIKPEQIESILRKTVLGMVEMDLISYDVPKRGLISYDISPRTPS